MRSNRAPASPDFSGWNWVALSGPFSTAATNRSPPPDTDPASAQVRLTVDSDDLVAMAYEELNPAKAWAAGRLKVEASVFDLLRLRRLL